MGVYMVAHIDAYMIHVHITHAQEVMKAYIQAEHVCARRCQYVIVVLISPRTLILLVVRSHSATLIL